MIFVWPVIVLLWSAELTLACWGVWAARPAPRHEPEVLDAMARRPVRTDG